MKVVDRYIEEVMARVFAAPQERERFEADLRAHFADAVDGGESPAGIIADMGRPADVAAAFNAERKIRHAGFWRRLVAFAGDFGVMLALSSIPLAVLVLCAGAFESNAPPPVSVIVGLVTAGTSVLGIILFYFPLLEWRFGKTAGKHLMRLRVVRETGAPIGLGQAFVRRLSYYFELLVVDALFIPFTDSKQRALDIIAKTVVAREPDGEAPWWGWAVCLVLPLACLAAMAAVALCMQAG